MAQYLLQLNYTSEAWSALLNSPQDRGKSVEAAIQALGGKTLQFWMSLGDYDIAGIVEMPDTVSAAAFSMAICAGGSCRNVKTTPLLAMGEALDAMRKAATCGYQPVTASNKAQA
jgi:uncharacterized protein with GYD domain